MKFAELEEVQSRHSMKKDELVAMHDAQMKVAAELEQLHTPTANGTSESF